MFNINHKTILKYSYLLSLLFLSACTALHNQQAFVSTEHPLHSLQGAHQEKILERLILIGDAGKADKSPGKEHLKALTDKLAESDLNEKIVFLGDNIYFSGYQAKEIQCDGDNKSAKRIKAIIDVADNSNSTSYIIPGNHDWAQGDEDKQKLVYKQKDFIQQCSSQSFYEPASEDKLLLVDSVETDFLTLVFLDSQAIMYASDNEIEETKQSISKIFEKSSQEKTVLMLAHHPLITHGPHGGCHGKPGSIKSNVRKLLWDRVVTKGDVGDDFHTKYFNAVASEVPDERKLIFAAGHDHNLQVISKSNHKQLDKFDYHLVSGSGAKTSHACNESDTLFAQAANGYMALEVLESGSVHLNVYQFNLENKQLQLVYGLTLFEN